MTRRGRVVATAVAGLLLAAGAVAQDSRPSAALQAAVEAYFDAEDPRAEDALAAVLARPDATPETLWNAVLAPPPPAEKRGLYPTPYAGDLLQLSWQAPGPRAPDAPRLPVVFEISGGNFSAEFAEPTDYLVAFVNGYTPPQFSDEGRDGFLKLLRRAAWRLGGDPDRMWLMGYSWAGHAAFDTAMHRPFAVRGILTGGGGPRRTHFRLLPHLRDVETRMWVGGKDDPELVWNLKETTRLAPDLGIPAKLHLDPDAGHNFPHRDAALVPPTFAAVPARTDEERMKLAARPILADGPLVASPFVRIDAVDPVRTEAPARVPVDGRLSYDEQRRRTVKAYEKYVARVTPAWKIEAGGGAKPASTTLELAPDGVRALTVFLRAPWTAPGRRTIVRSKGRVLFDGTAAIDRETLLREARRTGERFRPAFAVYSVKF